MHKGRGVYNKKSLKIPKAKNKWSIEIGYTVQWPKEKEQKDKQWYTFHYTENQRLSNTNPLERGCSGRVGIWSGNTVHPWYYNSRAPGFTVDFLGGVRDVIYLLFSMCYFYRVFVFILCLVCPMLPVSLNCSILDCPFVLLLLL